MRASNAPNPTTFTSGPKIVVSPNEIGFQMPDQKIWGIGGPDLLCTITNISVITFLASPPSGIQSAYFTLSMNNTCNGWYTYTTWTSPPGGMYFGLEFLNPFGGALQLWSAPRFDVECADKNKPQVWQQHLDPNLFPLIDRVSLHVNNDVDFSGCSG
jgi:hypothetical protein